MKTKKIPKPIGDFIIENATGVQGVDGVYYHYSEVIKLLRLYGERGNLASEKITLDMLNLYRSNLAEEKTIKLGKVINKEKIELLKVKIDVLINLQNKYEK